MSDDHFFIEGATQEREKERETCLEKVFIKDFGTWHVKGLPWFSGEIKKLLHLLLWATDCFPFLSKSV